MEPVNLDTFKVNLGRQIRRLRKESGMSQEALADHCGVFRTYLSRIERGSANPSISIIALLAMALSVDVIELFRSDA